MRFILKWISKRKTETFGGNFVEVKYNKFKKFLGIFAVLITYWIVKQKKFCKRKELKVENSDSFYNSTIRRLVSIVK